MTALHWLGLVEAGDRIRAGELTSADLTDHMLTRIEAHEPDLRSYVTVTPDIAHAQAEEADRAIAAGETLSPLHGVPIAVKDLCDTAGIATTAGMAIHKDRIPKSDCTVVIRLKAAGAVLLGKLKMTEGAFSAHHPDVEPPLNPWSAGHWTGVSSSGSGVATAAGLCFGSLGSDTGGSIRFPSASNGIVGLKPTWGRVSRAGVFPLADTLDHIGPMTRNVLDAAAMLSVIAGADLRDSTASQMPVADYKAFAGRDIKGLRIGYDEVYCREYVYDPVNAAVVDAVTRLESLGCEIVPIQVPDVRELVAGWAVTCGTEVAIAHEETYPERADEYGPALRGLIELGRGIPAREYARLEIARREFRGGLNRLFESVDLILTPSMAMPPPEADGMGRRTEDTGEINRALLFTAPFDYSGSPTLSIPWGFTADGLPLSVQLIARDFDEAILVQAGHALEQAGGWHTHHPDV